MHGVQGTTLGWISCFLIGRTQTVVLNDDCSDVLSVMSGVPQGLVLRSIMFLLYINDLPANVQSQIWLFADAIQCTWHWRSRKASAVTG